MPIERKIINMGKNDAHQLKREWGKKLKTKVKFPIFLFSSTPTYSSDGKH